MFRLLFLICGCVGGIFFSAPNVGAEENRFLRMAVHEFLVLQGFKQTDESSYWRARGPRELMPVWKRLKGVYKLYPFPIEAVLGPIRGYGFILVNSDTEEILYRDGLIRGIRLQIRNNGPVKEVLSETKQDLIRAFKQITTRWGRSQIIGFNKRALEAAGMLYPEEDRRGHFRNSYVHAFLMDWDVNRSYALDAPENNESGEPIPTHQAAITPKDLARPFSELWNELTALILSQDLHLKKPRTRLVEILEEVAKRQGGRSLYKGRKGQGEIEACTWMLRYVQLHPGRKPKSR